MLNQEDPLGHPSIFSSIKWAFRTHDSLSIIVFSASTAEPLKSMVAEGTQSGTNIHPLPNQTFSTTSELELLLYFITRGELRLRSRLNAQITRFRALADDKEVLDEDSKRNARNAAPWIWDWLNEVRWWLYIIIPDLECEACRPLKVGITCHPRMM
jgi:hypothetical protein